MRTALALAALLATTSQVSATVITFDDLPTLGRVNTLVPPVYAGLFWSNFGVLDAAGYDAFYGPNGYTNGMVSYSKVAYNSSGGGASIGTFRNTPFFLNSVFLTGAWMDGLQVTITGTENGSIVGSKTVTLSAYAPTQVDVGWSVTDVLFTSFGGVHAGFSGSGPHFAMDNLVINEPLTSSVPLPAGLPLLGASLLALAVTRRVTR